MVVTEIIPELFDRAQISIENHGDLEITHGFTEPPICATVKTWYYGLWSSIPQ